MAKQTLFELEHGKIEFNDDGETKVYTYNGKPFDELTEDQKAEIRDDPAMKQFVEQFKIIADALAKVFEQLKEIVVPVFNQISEMIRETEEQAAAEKAAAEAEEAEKAKKAETDEKK